MVEESPTDAPKCTLMEAYHLEDYDVEEWLTGLWQTKLNSEFKSQVNEVALIARIKSQLEAQYMTEYGQKATTEDESKDEASKDN